MVAVTARGRGAFEVVIFYQHWISTTLELFKYIYTIGKRSIKPIYGLREGLDCKYFSYRNSGVWTRLLFKF